MNQGYLEGKPLSQTEISQFAEESLERIRLRLLDLSRRNRLLNHRERARDIRIVDELPNETFSGLTDGRRFFIDPVAPPEDADLEESLTNQGTEEVHANSNLPDYDTELPIPGDSIAERHQDDRLQTPLDPQTLERRCKRLLTAARTAIEETGANFLYLAIGFLEWSDVDYSDQCFRAPLVMVPVEIRKEKFDSETDTFAYSIRFLEQDIETNLSLLEKMQRDFGLDLPEFGEEADPESYFAAVMSLTSAHSRWRVAREMILGLFSFSKILMYRELSSERWPANKRPSDHPIIRDILVGAEESGDSHAGLDLSEEYDIDVDERCAKIPLVVDADSSQHSALTDVLAENRNLVIHGPPGTGKSQTITNLIAAAIMQEKSVLFVAEKKAALEVVRSRLDACGLGDFVLELHSYRTNKGQLHADIERRMHRRFPGAPWLAEKREKFEQEKDRLLQYSEAARAPVGPDGEAFHKIVWRAGRYRSEVSAGFPDPPLGDLPILSRPEIENRAALLNECAQLWSEIPETAREAWRGIHLGGVFGGDLRHVTDVLHQLKESAETLSECLNAARDGGVPLSGGLAEIRFVSNLPDHVRSVPIPICNPASWRHLSAPAVQRAVELLHKKLASLSSFRAESALLSESPAASSSEQLTELMRATQTLLQLALSERTLPELERHLTDCSTASESAERLAGESARATDLLRRQAAFLSDYRLCVRLAELFRRTPSVVKTSFDPVWVDVDIHAIFAEAEDSASNLRKRHETAQKRFDTDSIPSVSELRFLADRLETVRNQSFTRFRSEYRELRAILQKFLRNRRDLRAFGLPNDLRQLSDLIEKREEFERSDHFRAHLGEAFKGLRTDWEELRQPLGWISDLVAEVDDPFFASGLIRDWESTATRAEQIAGSSARAIAALEEHLPRCFDNDQSDKPVDLISTLLNERIKHLRASLPILRAAQAPMSASVDSIHKAANARLSLIRTTEEVDSTSALPEALGSGWEGVQTDTESMLEAIGWLSALEENGLSRLTLEWICSQADPPRLDELMALAPSCEAFLSCVESTKSRMNDFGAEISGDWIPECQADLYLESVSASCQACIDTSAHAGKWIEFCRTSKRLSDFGLVNLVDLIREHSVQPRDAASFFCAAAYQKIAREAVRDNPLLLDFTRARHEQTVQRFQELDVEIQRLNQADIAQFVTKRSVPRGVGTGRVRDLTERSLIEHELTKKKRHIPIRQLVRRAGRALQALKPCFMMSPMSVAQYLAPGGLEFDLVVMDEASQVKPEDALGSILRAKQVVIVGDPKQLPPTTFFDRLSDDEDDPEEKAAAEESESILEIAQRAFPNRHLLWHYRSKHESLIAFSNSQFYHGNLIVFPSPFRNHPDYGVKHHYVSDATYRKSRNIVEAKTVAAAVRRHLIEHPDETLGVATFNADQRDLILNEIERLQKGDAELDRALRKQEEMDNKGSEPFFVKNLENVQGDEREVIFISTLYGPDPDTGTVFQRFGPITGDKGWRRLNVIFTRARKRLELFTSMRSTDIKLGDRRVEGVAALRGYLEFAETGLIPDFGRSTGDSDNDFELDVATVLRTRGYEVDSQIGVVGFFIDIGVKDPAGSGSYILGVECDGATYHSSKSARDRDRIRQDILERKGWRIHRVWSTDWFKNREAEIERLWEAVEAPRTASAKVTVADRPVLGKPEQQNPGDGCDSQTPESARSERARSLPEVISSEVWRRLGEWLLSTGHLSLAERGQPFLIADETFTGDADIRHGREIMQRAIDLGFDISR